MTFFNSLCIYHESQGVMEWGAMMFEAMCKQHALHLSASKYDVSCSTTSTSVTWFLSDNCAVLLALEPIFRRAFVLRWISKRCNVAMTNVC